MLYVCVCVSVVEELDEEEEKANDFDNKEEEFKDNDLEEDNEEEEFEDSDFEEDNRDGGFKDDIEDSSSE